MARWPEKLCRCMAPEKPRPLLVAVDVDRLHLGESVDFDLAADRQIAGRSRGFRGRIASARSRPSAAASTPAAARLLGTLAVEFRHMTPVAATGQSARLVGEANLHRLVAVPLLGADQQARRTARLRSPSPGSPGPLRRRFASSRPCGRVFRSPSQCTLSQVAGRETSTCVPLTRPTSDHV